MLKINKRVEYALIVLKHFQGLDRDDLITARMICDIYNTPFDTTSKVMQLMNNNGILESVQGVKGGYRVAINLNEISYLRLTEIIEGKKVDHNCTKQKCGLVDTCNIIGPIQQLNKYLNYFFMGLTVKELLEDLPTNETLLNRNNYPAI